MDLLKRLFLITLTCIFALFLAEKSVAQSIDVKHYDISLADFSFTNQSFRGKTRVHFNVVSSGLNSITLELLNLQVDSVRFSGNTINFNYNSPELEILFPESLSTEEEHIVEVYYQGKPAQDPKGFGGFFFRNNIAFNIGVTMSIFPHNAGKMWFPCIDNFTDKATYEFHITAPNKMTAVCGGTLISAETDSSGNNTTYNWRFTDPISTYLASVAVGEYALVQDTFKAINGNIPITIYVKPGSESFVSGSFKNLKSTISLFESLFGPYVWQRIGYVAVPFYAGAMEHATNIAYPDLVINGGLQYETLWAHELSHSWFGNLVTCADAGDMWLNEGFARYSEALFIEYIYGKQQAKDYLRRLHAKTLKTAHYDDKGYFAVSGVPNSITYGKTVYDKGALVSHALRSYLGDERFYNALKTYFDEYRFGTNTSYEFRDRMSNITGLDLTDFFNDWVFTAGFSHTEIVSFTHEPEGTGDNFKVDLTIRQKQLARNRYLTNSEIEVMFLSVGGDTLIRKIPINEEYSTVSLTLPVEPLAVFLDPNEKYLDATVDQFVELRKAEVDINLTDVLDLQFNTDNPNVDPCFVRVSKHFVEPSDQNLPGLKWSNSYWSFEPTICTQPVNSLNITFYYNGDTTSGFDRPWIENEDSIIIFYRQNPTQEWTYIKDAELTTGSNVRDLKGDIFVSKGRFGQYTMASRNGFVVGRKDNIKNQSYLTIEPNPATQSVQIVLKNVDHSGGKIILFNQVGQAVLQSTANENNVTISVVHLPEGIYHVHYYSLEGTLTIAKLLIVN